jgi:hypothetical protein
MSEKINNKEEESLQIAFSKKPSIYRKYRSFLSRLNDDEKMELIKNIKYSISKLGGYEAAGTLDNPKYSSFRQRYGVIILKRFSEFNDSNNVYVLNLLDLNQTYFSPNAQHNMLSWLERNGWLSSPATVTLKCSH